MHSKPLTVSCSLRSAATAAVLLLTSCSNSDSLPTTSLSNCVLTATLSSSSDRCECLSSIVVLARVGAAVCGCSGGGCWRFKNCALLVGAVPTTTLVSCELVESTVVDLAGAYGLRIGMPQPIVAFGIDRTGRSLGVVVLVAAEAFRLDSISVLSGNRVVDVEAVAGDAVEVEVAIGTADDDDDDEQEVVAAASSLSSIDEPVELLSCEVAVLAPYRLTASGDDVRSEVDALTFSLYSSHSLPSLEKSSQSISEVVLSVATAGMRGCVGRQALASLT
jgi:hypothetical protein